MSHRDNEKHRSVGAYSELLHAVREIIDASPVRLTFAEWLDKARHTADDIKQFSQLEYEKTRYYI